MRAKIEVDQVLRGVFRTYREQAGLLLPAALIVFLPIALLNAGLATPDEQPNLGLLEIAVLGALAAALGVVGTYWYQGMVVEAARDIRDDRRDLSLGGLFRSVTPVLGALIVAGILGGLGIGIGLVLLIVPGLLLLTWWALLAPVIVIERTGAMAAFGRSRALVRGNGWQVFGVIFLLFLLQAVVSAVLGALGGSLGGEGLGSGIGRLLANVIVAPLFALAAATMYFELTAPSGGGVADDPGGDRGAGARAGGEPDAPPPAAR